MSWLPRQNDYRTFCMNGEAEKEYQNLEKVIELLTWHTFPIYLI